MTRTTGAAYCWGNGGNGQIGDGQRDYTGVPTAVLTPAMRDVASGYLHSCGITTTGIAYCWGERSYGSLGDGISAAVATPAAVTGAGSGYTAVAAGYEFTCGLSGTSPRCWGHNDAHQLGDNTYTDRLVPTLVAGGLSFTRISTGEYHACALTSGGTAYCWGDNYFGQLGNGNTSSLGIPVAVTGGSSFGDIAPGQAYFSCGVTSSGEVRCWGSNGYGELGDGTTTTHYLPAPITGVAGKTFTKVTTGYQHVCALTTTGQLYCWGRNTFGQLGNGTTSSGATSTPVLVNVGATVATVAAGYYHTCALTTSGAAYCWGRGYDGALGLGTWSSGVTTPTAVAGSLVFRSISAGYSFTCGVTTANVAYCWGTNAWGQLGTGGTEYALAPAPVSGGTGYSDVRAGYAHACGVTTGGAARCWGHLRYGELGTGVAGIIPTPAQVQGGVVFNQETCAGENCGVALLSLPAPRLFGSSFAGIHHVRQLPRPGLAPPQERCFGDEPCRPERRIVR